MKTIALTLVFLSSAALAQTSTGTEASGDCIPCRTQGSMPVPISREMQKIFDESKATSRFGAQKIIELEAKDHSQSENRQSARDRELNNYPLSKEQRFEVTIDSAATFDQQTADDVARAMRLKGLKDANFIDVHIAREISDIEKAEVLARLRKGLKIEVSPAINNVRENLGDYKKAIQAGIFGKDGSDDFTNKDYGIASALVDSFRVSGKTVVMRVAGKDTVDMTHAVEVVKGAGEKVRLEARYGKNNPGSLSYAVGANTSSRDEQGKGKGGAVYFYVSCPLTANFKCAK
jgi:hypothetical protein